MSRRSAPRDRSPSPPSPELAADRSLTPVVAGVLTSLFVALVVLFFTTRLPNNSQLTRSDVLASTPDLLLDLLPGGKGLPNSGWRYFPQRLDLVLIAGAAWLAAWALGRLALRAVRLFPRLDPLERHLWGCAAGIGLWSLTTLGLGLAGVLSPWLFRILLAAVIIVETVLTWRQRSRTAAGTPSGERRYLAGSSLPLVVGLAVTPFLMAMLLGAMLPSTEFDAREYHLEGPKEYFQSGRIQFLPHNVYTSFPFATEMLYLLGMVLHGDWFRGARVGQTILMGFAPLTAGALFYAGRRWFSDRVGCLAALIWLTAPWTYRISTVFYTEGGLAAFLLLAFVAAVRAREAWHVDPASSRGWFLLAGFLAGSGPACKYPGAISVAIPMFVLVAWTVLRRPRDAASKGTSSAPFWNDSLAAIVLFLAGGAIAFGPWLAKNFFETGNPFYPLMYSLFGGRGWDADLHARWQAGHPLPLGHFRGLGDFLRDQGLRFLDAFLWNDWQTPLALAAVPVAVLLLAFRSVGTRPAAMEDDARSRADRMLVLLLLESFWLFEAWCLLSHRLDRFWVPALPIACWIAAVVIDKLLQAGANDDRSPVARLARSAAVWSLLAGVTLFHLALISSGLCGNNAWLLSEKVALKQFRNSSVAVLEELPLPERARVLFVGEAEVFEAHFDNVYNTVFNRSIFEEWFKQENAGPPAEAPLKPKGEILRTLADHGITHVAVNWSEILRYRPTYTYTDFVHPDRFHALAEMGVLRRLPGAVTFREFAKFPDDQRREVERWAPGLVRTLEGKAVVPGVQVYEVVK